MGKDREENYALPKGRPSGLGKEESDGFKTVNSDQLEESNELEDRYTEGPGEIGSNVRLMNPNRNVDKGEGDYREKENIRHNKSKHADYKEEKNRTVAQQLPGILTKDVFSELADYKAEHCISIYLPTHSSGREVNEQYDTIKYKNALQNIALLLREKGLQETEIGRILEPAYQLMQNEKFWYNLDQGLGIFIADGFFKYIKMSVQPVEKIVTNSSFFVTPLTEVVGKDRYFYLLVISKKQAKFYRVNNFTIEHLQIDELPYGIEDVIRISRKQTDKLYRQGDGRTQSANFHGMGDGRRDNKTQIALYLEEVDDTLWKEILHNENAPLLLAGVDYLLPIYKEVTDYNYVWDKAMTGSYEHEDDNTLYQEAKKIMEPYFNEPLTKALENFGNLSGAGLTSSAPEEIIPASYYGRVSDLFVQKDEHIWGSFNKDTGSLTIHDDQQNGDVCLLDKAVIQTIVNGGQVHIMAKNEVPGGGKIAASMRY